MPLASKLAKFKKLFEISTIRHLEAALFKFKKSHNFDEGSIFYLRILYFIYITEVEKEFGS
jgi:hypothetical protein